MFVPLLLAVPPPLSRWFQLSPAGAPFMSLAIIALGTGAAFEPGTADGARHMVIRARQRFGRRLRRRRSARALPHSVKASLGPCGLRSVRP